MAKLEEYRQYIQNLLKQHASMVWDKRRGIGVNLT